MLSSGSATKLAQTALPEEPILLRIYKSEPQSSGEAEVRFHRLLEPQTITEAS